MAQPRPYSTMGVAEALERFLTAESAILKYEKKIDASRRTHKHRRQ